MYLFLNLLMKNNNMDFSSINYLAVLVSGIAMFALGSLWYTLLFGKVWQKESGMTDEKAKGANMAVTMGSSFLLMVVMAFGLAILIQGHEGDGVEWLSGLYHGLVVGLLFIGASIGINYLYQLKSFKLWLIDAMYQIICLGIAGVILGGWH